MTYTIALFGESEKGDFHKPYYLHALPELIDRLGQPPPQSLGLYFAVQALLFERNLIYFRVAEEGYSSDDYLAGIKALKDTDVIHQITAFCIPGVGDEFLIDEVVKICTATRSIVISTESDLFDYFMRSQ